MTALPFLRLLAATAALSLTACLAGWLAGTQAPGPVAFAAVAAGSLAAAVALARVLGARTAAAADAARRLAAGDMTARVRGASPDALASAINDVAARFDRQLREMGRERAQLGSILDNMVEAVVALGADGRVVAVNPALCRTFGLVPGAVVGRPLLESLRHAQVEDLVRAALGGAQGTGEIRTFSPDERTFEAHAAALEGGGALLVLHDITRLRKLEQVRKDFVANVSHELRTPLAAIKGFAETLRTGGLDDKENRGEFVGSIESQADRMTRLVDDLLELSAIESGRRQPQREPVELAGLARETAASLEFLARRRGVGISVSGAGQAPADRAQMRQVLTNLLDNAVKFNKEGGSVTITVSQAEGRVEVAVADTGAGIPESDLPRIFERFYRVDKARSRELGGTGLGLSIVKHIVEGHGGAVSVESRPGLGSTLRFTLPA